MNVVSLLQRSAGLFPANSRVWSACLFLHSEIYYGSSVSNGQDVVFARPLDCGPTRSAVRLNQDWSHIESRRAGSRRTVFVRGTSCGFYISLATFWPYLYLSPGRIFLLAAVECSLVGMIFCVARLCLLHRGHICQEACFHAVSSKREALGLVERV